MNSAGALFAKSAMATKRNRVKYEFVTALPLRCNQSTDINININISNPYGDEKVSSCRFEKTSLKKSKALFTVSALKTPKPKLLTRMLFPFEIAPERLGVFFPQQLHQG